MDTVLDRERKIPAKHTKLLTTIHLIGKVKGLMWRGKWDLPNIKGGLQRLLENPLAYMSCQAADNAMGIIFISNGLPFHGATSPY